MRRGHSRQFRFNGNVIFLVLAACCLSGMVYYSQRFQRHPADQVLEEHGGGSEGLRAGRRFPLKEEELLPDHSAGPGWSCPLVYERTDYEDVKVRNVIPYLLGGLQRPECKNCHEDQLWSHFCKYESHGPTCTDWDKWRLTDAFIQRAEQGAPGMKEMLTMSPCDLFELIEGRTLWFIGDSLTQEFQRAFQCFFYEFWDLKIHDPLVLTEDPEAKAAYSKLPSNGWCVFMLRNTNICHLRANYGQHLVEDMFPHLWRLGAVKSDIVLFNFGVWHNDLAGFEGNASLVEAYLQAHRRDLPFLVWRDSAPQHFDTPTGEFGCAGCPAPKAPYQCKAVENVTLNARNELETSVPSKQVLVEGGWRNRVMHGVMQRMGIPMVQIWNQSMPIWDFHHNFQTKDDCTHMCHPSAYQLWVFQFYELLQEVREQLPPIIPKPEIAWRPEMILQD